LPLIRLIWLLVQFNATIVRSLRVCCTVVARLPGCARFIVFVHVGSFTRVRSSYVRFSLRLPSYVAHVCRLSPVYALFAFCFRVSVTFSVCCVWFAFAVYVCCSHLRLFVVVLVLRCCFVRLRCSFGFVDVGCFVVCRSFVDPGFVVRCTGWFVPLVVLLQFIR
jgi:hypothetical protein